MASKVPATDLTPLFRPRSIVLVGATDEARRPGGQPIVTLTEYGFRGELHLVNPARSTVRGRPCHASLAEVPPCDVALIAVPASGVPEIIEQCGMHGVAFAIVLSAGFREAGDEALERRLRDAIRTSGVRVIGPNCVGLLNLRERVFAGFGAGFRNPNLKPGPIGMVTQSGGFGYSLVAFAQAAGLGFDYVVSTGNETDIDTTEVLSWLIEQPDVEILVSYLEGVTHGERLRTLGERALELGKPILVWKVGNTSEGRAAAASHTANLTADYDLYREVFRRGGFVEVREMYDIVDVAAAFLPKRLPAGRSVGVVTTSGGAGVLLADECVGRGLSLPPVGKATLQRLEGLVPGFAALDNPMDLSAQLAQNAERFNAATEAIVADPAIDQLILRSFPGAALEDWARGLQRIARNCSKPILISISGLRQSIESVIGPLADAGVPSYETPARAAVAAAALAEFADKRRRAGAQLGPAQRPFAARALSALKDRGALSEFTAGRCLAEYDIPVARTLRLSLEEVHELQALPLAGPLAVKVSSRDIGHKTEAGGVRLGISDLGELKQAASAVVESAQRHSTGAQVDGVLIQQMVRGVEVLAGGLNDRYFGPLVVFGAGGTLAEVLSDRALRFAPFDEQTARQMIHETRVSRLLAGYRGAEPCDIDALAATLSRLSWLIADHRDAIAEIDVNPIFVHPRGQGVTAADALIVPR